MNISVDKILRLTFSTTGGGTFSIVLPNPKPELETDPADALALMEEIIENNIFLTTTGTLRGIKDIKIVDTKTTDIYDTPQP